MSHTSSISGSPVAGRIEPALRRPDVAGAQATKAAAASQVESTSRVRIVDTVDLSELARRAAKAEAPFRADLVEKIKAQIEAGTYESAEKIEAAVEQIVKDLDLTA